MLVGVKFTLTLPQAHSIRMMRGLDRIGQKLGKRGGKVFAGVLECQTHPQYIRFYSHF